MQKSPYHVTKILRIFPYVEVFICIGVTSPYWVTSSMPGVGIQKCQDKKLILMVDMENGPRHPSKSRPGSAFCLRGTVKM